MLDNNNKELDRLFQSKLQNNEAAENKWNVPPIDVFENALSEIDAVEPEKKRRWPFILLIGAGFLMLSSVGYLFYKNQRMMHELDKKIEVLNQAQKENENLSNSNLVNIENKISKEAPANSIIDNAVAEDKQENNSTTTPKKNIVSNNTTAKQRTPNNNDDKIKPIISTIRDFNQNTNSYSASVSNPSQTNLISVSKSKVENQDAKRSSTVHIKTTLVTKSDENSFVSIPSIPTLSFQILETSKTNLPLLPLALSEKAVYSKDKDSKKLSPYFILGSHLSGFNTSYPNKDAVITNDPKFGLQVGFGMVHKLSDRWALDYSLGFKNYVTKSNYSCELIYDKDEEGYNSNGELVYNMDMEGVTPLYDTFQRVEIPVNENEMADGDIMDNKTETKITFNVLSAKVGARYQAANFGNFNFYLNGGVGANWLMNSTDEMEMQITHIDKVMMDKTATSGTTAGNAVFYTGYLGAQLDYQINDRLSIGWNNNFERSFNSLYVNPAVNSGQSNLNSINSTLRIGYDF